MSDNPNAPNPCDRRNAEYLGLDYEAYQSDAVDDQGYPIWFAQITHPSKVMSAGYPMPLFQDVASKAGYFLSGVMWGREIFAKGDS